MDSGVLFHTLYTHGRRKDFFQGGAKNYEISFFPLETKKTTFFAENFKIQGGPWPSLPPFRRVCISNNNQFSMPKNENAHRHSLQSFALILKQPYTTNGVK